MQNVNNTSRQFQNVSLFIVPQFQPLIRRNACKLHHVKKLNGIYIYLVSGKYIYFKTVEVKYTSFSRI